MAFTVSGTKQAVAQRPPTMWRYQELLPVTDESKIATLGEGMSPLLKCERLGAALGLNDLWVKDESQLPTGSFKVRGLAMAISRANELGVERVAIPTAGNAAARWLRTPPAPGWRHTCSCQPTPRAFGDRLARR